MSLCRRLRILMILVTFSPAPILAKDLKKGKRGDAVQEALELKEGDEKGNEIRSLKKELLVSSSETKAMNQLNALLKKHRGTPLEPDLLMRKAELYMRQAKSATFFELIRTSEDAAQFVPPAAKKLSSRQKISEAISLYHSIAKRFAKYANLDLVYFNAGFAYQQLGKHSEARVEYSRILKQFPTSPLLSETHLSLGEIYYSEKNFSKALDHYKMVRRFPDSQVYPYALYKSAWSLYNLREPEEGLKALEEVVAFGVEVQAQGRDSRLDLRSEALLDMALFFEEVHSASTAVSYFARQAGSLPAGPVIMNLAKIYERHGRSKPLEIVLRDFISEYPKDPLRGAAHNLQSLNFDRQKDHASAIDELTELSKICRPSSSWLKGLADDASKASCTSDLLETSRLFAIKWDKGWRRGKKADPTLSQAARRSYEVHFHHQTAKDLDVHQLRHSYAELLFELQDYRVASQQYAMVGRDSQDPKLRHDADYGALFALEKAVKDKWSDQDEEHFQNLAQIYISHNPKGTYRVDIEFKRAFIGYEKGKYDLVAPILKRLAWDHRTQEKGLKAQDLYLDILNIQKNYTEIRSFSGQLLKEDLQDQRKRELTKIYHESYFAEADQLRKKGDLNGAISLFRAFVAENTAASLSEKAWWNVIDLEYELHRYKEAADAALQFHTYFPKSKDCDVALKRALQTFENTGRFERVAHTLQLLAEREPKSKVEWLLMSARFYRLAHQSEKSERIYRSLIQDGQAAERALFELAHHYKQEDKSSLYHETLVQLARTGNSSYSYWAKRLHVETLFQKGDLADAYKASLEILKRDSTATVEDRAATRFVQSQILESEFRGQSVHSSVERLPLVLAYKTEKLEKTQKSYQDTIQYGVPSVTVHALKNLAESYLHFAESLRNIKIKGDLSPEDEKLVRSELEKHAVPMEEKGVETMAEALSFAKRSNLFSGLVAEIESRFHTLNLTPNRHVGITIETPESQLPEIQSVAMKGDGP